MVMLCLGSQMLQFCLEGISAFHGFENHLAAELIPGGGDDGCTGVMLQNQVDAFVQLLFGDVCGAAQNDAACVFNLVVEEFTEVLHVHLALGCVRNGGEGVQTDFIGVHALYGADDVGELADAGGFDQDTVGMEFIQNLLQRFAEVADETAADAAGVHFGDFETGVLQKTAVNADFTEFVFNQNQLLTGVRFLDQLLDQRGLAGTEKTGENINFGHIRFLS